MSLFDPYNQRRDWGPWRFLHPLNPLAKIFGPLPAMLLLFFTRDLATPLAFLLLAWLLIVLGAHCSRIVGGILVAIPLVAVLMSFLFGLWVDRSRLESDALLFQLGAFEYPLEAWLIGLATALRLSALISLTMISGLTTVGPDLVHAMIQQLRMPYRIGYTALASYRFVPRFAHELEVIRSAHRVRGMTGGRGPLAGARRYLGYIVPLLAGGIRHAERVALAMDARAFGAHPHRTERYLVPWRTRDWVFMLSFWTATAAIPLLTWAFVPSIGA